jgi:hypothetical protein
MVGLVDDVVVGDDVAARIHDEAGAESFALARTLAVKGTAAAVIIALALLATTAGPTCFTIWEKPLDNVTGLGMVSGRASVELDCWASLPLTLDVRTLPARMPIETAARMVKVTPRRPLRTLVRRPRPKLFTVLMYSVILACSRSSLLEIDFAGNL